MAVQNIGREQERALSTEDLKPYAGQWVAIRDGRVVASAFEAVELRNHPEVSDDDTIIPVPTAAEDLLIL
jgi:hypothetical protein